MKTIKCKNCQHDIASNAKFCPNCGANNNKPLFQKWWFWLILVVIVASVATRGGSNESNVPQNNRATSNVENEIKSESVVSPDEEKETADVGEKVPSEYKSALKKAKLYSDTMHMSKIGIYEQLTSEYGEKFTQEAARYAMDNLVADWNENALKKAKSYSDTMHMSKKAIYAQLISEYGEKFTEDEAQYAVDN